MFFPGRADAEPTHVRIPRMEPLRSNCKPNDRWLRLIGIPLVAFLVSVSYNAAVWQAGGWPMLREFAIGLVFTTVLWEGCRQIVIAARRRWPAYAETRRRLAVEVVGVAAYTVVADAALQALIGVWVSGPTEPLYDPALCLYSLIPTAILLGIYESMYFFNLWKTNLHRTEELARATTQAQFEALRQQLDPHFLFNSFNTLASLIEPENEAAQDYLERLSDVYRYVLETRERETVPLEEELRFLEAFVHLVRVRFRDNLRVEADVPAAAWGRHLPALSLQLLVENAIKHNEVSRARPLTIRIYQKGESLVVENNRQPKRTLRTSTGVGLKNIVRRYALLTSEPVVIENDETVFRVQIPLLAKTTTSVRPRLEVAS